MRLAVWTIALSCIKIMVIKQPIWFFFLAEQHNSLGICYIGHLWLHTKGTRSLGLPGKNMSPKLNSLWIHTMPWYVGNVAAVVTWCKDWQKLIFECSVCSQPHLSENELCLSVRYAMSKVIHLYPRQKMQGKIKTWRMIWWFQLLHETHLVR